MSITIASRQLSRDIALANPGKHNIISILEPEMSVPAEIEQFSKSFLPLWFHDVEFVQAIYTTPPKEDVEKALAWSEGKDELVVACHAGISRSSAIAYLCQCKRVDHPRLALNILTPFRHHPNSLIVKIGAEILKDRVILDEYYKWMNTNGPKW